MHGRSRSRDRSRGRHESSQFYSRNDFRVSSLSFGVSVPEECFYTRAACYSSVQWGTSSVLDLSSLNGVPNVIVRGRASDSWDGGIVLEEARTNLVISARDLSAAGWTLFGTATRTGGQASPFVDNSAYRIQANSGTHGIGESTPSATTSAFTTSAWLRSFSGTAAPNYNTFRTSAGRQALSTAVGTTWARLTQTLSGAGGETSTVVPVDGRDWSGIGGVVAGARDHVVDGVQREIGSFPTEIVPTAGATRTRAATFFGLNSSQVTRAVALGQLRLEMHLRPKGARTEYSTAAVALWWIDANNKAEFAPSTGTLTITVGGVTNTCALPSWARNDDIVLFFEVGGSIATRVRYSVNGAATVTPAITGSALGNVPAGAMHLCSTDTTNHLSCWLYRAPLYKPGSAPLWVAA